MRNAFFQLKKFLEDMDAGRDQLLFPFIRKHWPRWLLPNHLTGLRIILALDIIYLLLSGFQDGAWLMIIFVFAALLDLFDGSVARGLDRVTKLGAILDIIADKILILPVALFILIKFELWTLLFLLILPEIIGGVIVIYSKISKRGSSVTIFGKIKMVVECVAFAYIILFNYPNPPSLFPLMLLYAGVLLSFLHIVLYYLNPPPKIKNA